MTRAESDVMCRLLGTTQQLVLLALLRLNKGADNAAVLECIEHCTGRLMTKGALHTTLLAVQKKGYAASTWADAPTARAGRKDRRLFTVTPAGVQALAEVAAMLRFMSPETAPSWPRSTGE